MTKTNTVKIPLLEFKKGKREVYTNWTKKVVEWKNQTFPLSFVNIGGKRYPYVILENIKPLSMIKDDIETINTYKENLKGVEYEVNNHFYFVIGIGKEKIKAYKNSDKEPKYFAYWTSEGQYLLEELMKWVGQTALECIPEINGIDEI